MLSFLLKSTYKIIKEAPITKFFIQNVGVLNLMLRNNIKLLEKPVRRKVGTF